MRKPSGLILVILTVLVLISMPSFKGLSMIQLNRASDLPVGPDPGGALGIAGLDDGIPITIRGTAATAHREMGRITNNFAFPVQLTVTVRIRTVQFTYTSSPAPAWRDINIFFDRGSVGGPRAATLNFAEQGPYSSPQQLTTGPVTLNPGEVMVVSLDRNSRFRRFARVILFQAEALFSVAGSRVGAGNTSFTIENVGNLRKQDFNR